MFVTIQLKNPSQQDRFSEAQQTNVLGAPNILLPEEWRKGLRPKRVREGCSREVTRPVPGCHFLSIPSTLRNIIGTKHP